MSARRRCGTAGNRRRLRRAPLLAAVALAAAALTVTTTAGALGGPQISRITGYSGGTAVTKGKPKPASAAEISPTDIAYDPANGDEAVVAATGLHVYLIAGADEANEYGILTTPTTRGSLVQGDVYLVAGDGTRKIVSRPGDALTTQYGSTEPTAPTNPINAVTVAFDHSGNLLIGEKNSPGQGATAIQLVSDETCTTSCPYRLPTMVKGELYTLAGQGVTLPTWAIQFTFGVFSTGLVVDSQGDILSATNGSVVLLNEQSTPVTRYGQKLPAHEATVIAGTNTTLHTGRCSVGGVHVHATGKSTTPRLGTAPALALDASNDLYITDNNTKKTQGCTWVLPATKATLDGLTVTAGYLYSLTGPNSATAATSGAAAATVSFPGTDPLTLEAAGNVVVATAGVTPSLRVIAETTGEYYDQTMKKGHVYFVAGGPGATGTTLPGTALGFKLAGPSSLTLAARGYLLLTDGSSATTQTAYLLTGAPTTVASSPSITSITPDTSTTAGGIAVTIHGLHLTGATAVSFGTTPATTVDAVNATTVTAVNPPHATGKVTVTVTTPGGTAILATGFTYHLPKPVVSAVFPATGSADGGRTVTVEGEFLTGASAVKFGPNFATAASIHVVSATAITVRTPAGSLGSVAVAVTTPGGTTPLGTGFTYVTGVSPGSPTISSVTRPVTGGVIQGHAVTVAWTAPSSTGGHPITGYTVTSEPGGRQCTSAGSPCTVSGLTNGTTYGFAVVAVTVAGTSAPSASAHLAPGTVPGRPGLPTALRGNAAVTVRWTAPTPTTSGFPITNYTVTSTPGHRTCTWTVAATYECTVTGLKNGTTYNFTVTATNAVGTSLPSANTLYPATPVGVVPTSPTNVFAYPANEKATVTWTPPTTDGGSPITGYTVTATPGGKTCTSTTLACTMTGLTNGIGYEFTVKATNIYGSGLTSAPSLRVTPTTEPTQAYWEVASDGGVFNFGLAQFYGSMGGKPLNAPIVGVALASTGEGYYEVAADGGIFAFGTAPFYGSMGGKPLNAPVVGLAVAPGGKGYYEVAADGGIFAFGTAPFYGSMGGVPLNEPVVGMQVASTGKGYYEVAADGGIFTFNSTPDHPAAPFRGSMGGQVLNKPIVSLLLLPSGRGYYEIAADGGVFAFGTAPFLGSTGAQSIAAPVVASALTPTAQGYWEVGSNGAVYPFGTAQADGSMAGRPLDAPIVAVAGSGG